MSFFESLLKTLSPTKKRRAVASRSGGLSIERLEERWTPAVSIVGQGTDNVVINDDNTGKTNNSIEIIDDLDKLTTYIRINGGREQVLGRSGDLLTTLKISMGAGDDKVKFSVRGDDYAYDGSQSRSIDLGDGNDVLTLNFNGNRSLGGYELNYAIFGDTRGNDVYNVAGGVLNGRLHFDAYSVREESGNEKYNFDLVADNARVELDVFDMYGNDVHNGKLISKNTSVYLSQYYVLDVNGDDKYTLALGASSHKTGTTTLMFVYTDYTGSDVYNLKTLKSVDSDEGTLWVNDSGPGANTITYAQGDVDDAEMYVLLNFDGATSNKATIGGNAQLTNVGFVHVFYKSVGNAVDTITIDDNRVASGGYAHVEVLTGGGDDNVSVKLDGNKSSKPGVSGDDSEQWIEAVLGDGHDVFKAVFAGNYTVDGSGTNLGARLYVDAHGGKGDDRMTIDANGRTLALKGYGATFDTIMRGGDGNDVIDVNVGSVAPSGPYSSLRATLDGGIGADRILFAGFLKNDSPYLQAYVDVDLGDDADVDTLNSTFRPANGVKLPIQADLAFYYRNFVAFRDAINVASTPGAPVWVGL